jgi:hypothetical protein
VREGFINAGIAVIKGGGRRRFDAQSGSRLVLVARRRDDPIRRAGFS